MLILPRNIRWYFPLLIFILALLVRIPYIQKPERTVFDEILYETFSVHYLYNEPYFDAHPPLAVMLMAETAGFFNPDFRNHYLEKPDTSFANYPYVAIRTMVMLFGSTIPVSLYLITKKFSKSYIAAISAGVFSIFDNALIVYSRFILPDLIMISLGLGGIALILYSEELWSNKKNILLFLFGCVFLALGALIKWLAFAPVAFVLLRFLMRKEIRKFVIFLLVIVIVHLLTWIVFFNRMGNASKSVYYPYEKYYGRISYPDGTKFMDIVNYLPKHFIDMYKVNRMLTGHESASDPLVWPIGSGKINFYQEKEINITLQPNYPAWLFVMASIVISIVLISSPSNKQFISGNITQGNLTILVFGYLVGYLPLFFVQRNTYLYHYFNALVFGYIILAVLLRIINNKWVWLFSMVAVLLGFMVNIPQTYGLAL